MPGLGLEAELAEEREVARLQALEAQRLAQVEGRNAARIEGQELRAEGEGAARLEAEEAAEGGRIAAADEVKTSAVEVADDITNVFNRAGPATEEEVARMTALMEKMDALIAAQEEVAGGREETAALKELAPEELVNSLKNKFPSIGSIVKYGVGLAVLAAFMVRGQMVSKDDCIKNCEKLLNPPLTTNFFGTIADGDQCLSDPSAPSGNADNCNGSGAPVKTGGNSKENCCCDVPPRFGVNYLTGATCDSFCNEDCTDEKLKQRAIDSVMNDPGGALRQVSIDGLDTVIQAADSGFDFILFLTNYGLYIIGFIFLIFMIYFLIGLGKGVKVSAKVAGEQAIGFGMTRGTTAAAAEQLKQAPRRARKKLRKKYK